MIKRPFILACSHPLHSQESASFYCLEQSCHKNRIHCALCLTTHHLRHSSRPLKFFWHEIQRDLDAGRNSIGAFAKIDSLKDLILTTCNQIQDHHLKKIVLAAGLQYFERVNDCCRLKNVIEISDILQNSAYQNIDRLLELLEAYCLGWEKNYDENPSPKPNFTRFLALLIEELTCKHNLLAQALKKADLDISVAEIFAGESSSKKFTFDAKLMHSGLTLVDKTKVKISNYADYNYFALCQPQLSTSKVQQISFKMNQLSSYVTVGIAKKNKVEGQYEFISSGLGHGSFQVSFDGYVWSDSDSAVNEQYSGWYYNQGDTVTVEMNPKTKKLKFTKNSDSGSPSHYEMGFEFDKGDKLHFCVTLNSEPQQIEIVS